MSKKQNVRFTIEIGKSPGIEMLFRARVFSCDAGRSPWDFAVEVDALLSAGMTLADLRWLVAKGFAEHADEMTRPSHKRRHFRAIRPLIFNRRTCLVLTNLGFSTIARSLSPSVIIPGDATRSRSSSLALETPPAGSRDTAQPCPAAAGVTPPENQHDAIASRGPAPNPDPPARDIRMSLTAPNWNAASHELRLGHRVVKRYKRPAKSQELILTAFEEEGWPKTIDDPLPADRDQNPKRRLHYTVHHLNRVQRPLQIHFTVNGSGQSVHWTLARDRREIGARRARKRR
jgi:hypothetical protein